MVGLPDSSPKISIPQPIIHQGQTTLNNITVSESVLGSINTAQVKQIDVAMDNIRVGGNSDLSDQLKTFTQSVINSNDLQADFKKELIESLSFIASQFACQQSMRKSTILMSVLSRMGEIVNTVTSLAPLWAPLLCQIKKYFELGH